MILNITLNGMKRSFEFEPHEYLVDVLRRNGLMSVKKACDTGSCGVCTVIIDEKPVLSCSYYAARAEGKNIKTVEGMSEDVQKLGEFLVEEGVDQCGYCSPGLILTVIAMKNELKNPNKDSISEYLTGNLCRCTGYVGQLRAIMKYMEVEA